MKIDRITYQKVFPLGAYVNERIGLEASLDEGENPETSLNNLKTMVEELHKATISELDLYRGTSEKVVETAILSNEDKKKQQIAGFVEAITTCTTLKALQIFEKLVQRENIDELYEAYSVTKKRLENV